jgi:uncharacterized protein (DUF2141 family)
MKTSVFIVTLLAVVLSACGSNEPAYIDNGHPGQVKVIVFYDDNRNGMQDGVESGAPVEVGISQDLSCPASSLDKNTFSSTDGNGTTLFNNLKPGRYCVALNGNYNMTTKATVELYVSSDQRATIHFGIVRE